MIAEQPVPNDAWKTNGRVTVVIPTFNRAHLLPRAIESALAQTVAPLCDIVVVDDGSTDDTRAVAARYGDRVRYVYRANGGLAAARNTGMRACLNEFVAFLDDDDVWEPDKTERQLEAMRAWPTAILIAGRARIFKPDGTTKPHPVYAPLERPVDFAPYQFEENAVSVPMVLVRRTAFDVAGLFDEDLRRGEDYLMWSRLARVGPFVYLDRVVCTYSAPLPDGLSFDRVIAMRAVLHVRRMLKHELPWRVDCHAAWHRGMALNLAILRDLTFRRGRYAQAAVYAVRSLLHRPWGRPRWEWGRLLAALWLVVVGPSRVPPEVHEWLEERPCQTTPGKQMVA